MANPVEVTITATGFSPCAVTLYKSNPGATRPNSVKLTNNATQDAIFNFSTAASYLATTAPPNNSNPAGPNTTIPAGQSVTLWVKDTAQVGNGYSSEYSITINSNSLSCTTQDPPDMVIEP